MGIHQLKKLDQFLEARAHYARLYSEAFSEMPEIETPVVHRDRKHAWYLYVIKVALERLKIDRARFIQELHKHNIGTSVHFIPVHLHPYYREAFGYHRGDLKHAESTRDDDIDQTPKYDPALAQRAPDYEFDQTRAHFVSRSRSSAGTAALVQIHPFPVSKSPYALGITLSCL